MRFIITAIIALGFLGTAATAKPSRRTIKARATKVVQVRDKTSCNHSHGVTRDADTKVRSAVAKSNSGKNGAKAVN